MAQQDISMKRFFTHPWVIFFVVMTSLVLGPLTWAYWRVRNIDPEGACRELKYLAMCISVIGEDQPPFNFFRKLPTDQALIDNFYRHRQDFDAALRQILANRSLSESFHRNPEWRMRSGVTRYNSWNDWPQTTYLEQPIQPSKTNRERAFAFHIASTKYIRGAEQEWPWVGREKGYVYFPQPAPRIADGWLVGPMYDFELSKVPKGWSQKGWPYPGNRIAWRVRNQLDHNWPADWASFECLLRPIEPQWFIYLCKDQTGG